MNLSNFRIGVIDSGEHTSDYDSSRILLGLYGSGGSGAIALSAYCSVGVGDVRQELVRRNAKHFGICNDRVYKNVDSMLEQEDLNIVLVCMEPSKHRYEIILQLLMNDVHVFTEKPPASLIHTLGIIGVCRKHGVHFCGSNTRRFFPSMREALKRMDGPIAHGRFSFCVGSYADLGRFYQNALILYTDLVCFIGSAFSSSSAISAVPVEGYLLHSSESDIALSAVLRYPDGAIFSLDVTTLGNWQQNYDSFQISNIEKNTFYAKNSEDWIYSTVDSVYTSSKFTNEFTNTRSWNPMTCSLSNFLHAIASDKQYFCSSEDIFAGVWLRDRIIQCMENGERELHRKVEVPEIDVGKEAVALGHARNCDLDSAIRILEG